MSQTRSSTPEASIAHTTEAQADEKKWADNKRRAELARKAGRFRILIVGRANAGKTTILKKICKTTDNPDIYDSDGQKIDLSNIEPSAKRGIHDIANEMIFQSNPGFIFHDSRGFEAGGVDELQKVKNFLSQHSRKKELKDQVHVIWFCIPMDNSRPIGNAEVQFFSKLGTGKVPVIAVFTKCEALEVTAVEVLEKDFSYLDAVKRAPDYVKKNLQNTHLDLARYKYPPKGHVYLQEMEKLDTDCKQLVECTASVLDTNILQGIFVSTQQVSVETSIRYAIQYVIMCAMGNPTDRNKWILNTLEGVMFYFPFVKIDYSGYGGYTYYGYDYHGHLHSPDKEAMALASKPMVDAHASSPIQDQIIQLGIAFVIVAEHLYFVWRNNHSISSMEIPTIVTQYQDSPQSLTITRQVADAIKEYSNGVAKLELEPGPKSTKLIWRHTKVVFQKRNAKKVFKDVKDPRDTFQETLYTIVLENRLDKTGL